ncbi:hypothetical protein [Streptomyces chryseus]
MSASAVPDAVDALVDILRTVTDPQTITVTDGPPRTNASNDQLLVGWQPGGEASVTLTQDFAGAGARRRDEAFEIHGYIEARSGDPDMQARRHRAFEILGLIETALRASDAEPQAPTLRGTVQWAHLTAGNLTQDNSDGSQAGLAFSVTCRARI